MRSQPALLRFLLALLVVAPALGCSSEESESPLPHSDPGPPPSCSPIEVQLPDGSCLPAGVPPDACAAGFESDGDARCVPVLPSEDCAAGQMAVPGDSVCRPPASCGAAPWGDIQLGSNTQHVDGSYAGMDSDGSATKPWTNIQQGVDAAVADAVVAIAAGSYLENVQIVGTPVVLWGRCPELVEISGGGTLPATIDIRATGTVVRGVAVTGNRAGFIMSDVADVSVEQSWVHDTGDPGVLVVRDFGPATLHLRDTLVERVVAYGALALGTELIVERTQVRDVAIEPGGVTAGVFGAQHQGTLLASRVEVHGSLIERSEAGIGVNGGELVVDGTVVRNTGFIDGAVEPVGVVATNLAMSAPSLVVTRSVLQRNARIGVLAVAGTTTVDATTVSETLDGPMGRRGRAIELDAGVGLPRGTLTLSRSTIERAGQAGVAVFGNDAVITDSIVRDILTPNGVGLSTAGISFQQSDAEGAPANGIVRRSIAANNGSLGVLAFGSVLTVEESVVLGTLAQGEIHGDGIVLFSSDNQATGTVRNVTVRDSGRAGMANFGGLFNVSSILFECNQLDMHVGAWGGFEGRYDDGGAVVCGCVQEADSCRVDSVKLEPPAEL